VVIRLTTGQIVMNRQIQRRSSSVYSNDNNIGNGIARPSSSVYSDNDVVGDDMPGINTMSQLIGMVSKESIVQERRLAEIYTLENQELKARLEQYRMVWRETLRVAHKAVEVINVITAGLAKVKEGETSAEKSIFEDSSRPEPSWI
jgi:hypothetical protein